MEILMHTSSNNKSHDTINFIIVGKPNSGKSTLFNNLLKDDISPAGETYGLTKDLFTEKFRFKNYFFIIHDTPGLRRKNKIDDEDEKKRNQKVLKLIEKIDAAILLIDATENLTRQDFKIAEIVLRRKKILLVIFNKIDLIDDPVKYKKKINLFLENNYSQYKEINTNYISALSNTKIEGLLGVIIKKMQLSKIKLKKIELNNFIKKLRTDSRLPKIKNIEVRPKYIVQVESDILKFKIFINTKNKAPRIFTKFFDNEFRKFFSLKGVPVAFQFVSSNNPYSG